MKRATATLSFLALAALAWSGAAYAQRIDFTFDTNRPFHAPASDNHFTYTYDAAGNLKTETGSGSTTVYFYNAYNKMKRVEKDGIPVSGFLYDMNGVRIAKTDGNGVVKERYFGEIEQTETSNTRYYFVGSTRVAKRDDGNVLAYIHQDHLGSASVVTDETGGPILNRKFYEFGAVQSQTGTDHEAHSYNDKRLDEEIDQYDYESKILRGQVVSIYDTRFDCAWCRNPQSWNRYAYVRNNPLRYIDPTGHFDVEAAMRSATHLYESPQERALLLQQAADRFGIMPQGITGWLRNDAYGFLTATNVAVQATGHSPSGLSAAAWNEGLAYEAGWYDKAQKGNSYRPTNISSGWPLGLESFASSQATLENEGYLPNDFSGFTPHPTATYTNEGTKRNPEGQTFQLGTFDTMPSAVTAMSAILSQVRDQVIIDAAMEVPYDNALLTGWAYAYYTAGAVEGSEALKKHGVNALYRNGDPIAENRSDLSRSRGDCIANGRWAAATAYYLEQGNILPAVDPDYNN